jgi:hypothetical protein
MVIYCADIGSVKGGRFGWARLQASETNPTALQGSDIVEFAARIAADINAGQRVALGFECPLFLPLPDDPIKLTSARPGEGDRPWSAGAGAAALATGLTETVWILEQVKRRVAVLPDVFVDWSRFLEAPRGLFMWEAFVTKAAKADTHHGDAERAVLAVHSHSDDLEAHNAVMCPGRVRSLFGAALLQSGWVTELTWLGEPCMVIRVKPIEPAA